jgi:hypothetical protein
MQQVAHLLESQPPSVANSPKYTFNGDPALDNVLLQVQSKANGDPSSTGLWPTVVQQYCAELPVELAFTVRVFETPEQAFSVHLGFEVADTHKGTAT